MDTSSFISGILQQSFPEECEVVGPANLEDIISSDVDFVRVEHGSNMDLGNAISTLLVAVTFIKTVVDLYIALRKELGREPEKVEVSIRIHSNRAMPPEMEGAIAESLIDAVIRDMKRRL